MSGTAAARWHAARNVLAVRLDNLGDLLMTTPALAAVRRSLPDARITVLASPSGAALAGHLPAVDRFIAYDAPWVGRAASTRADDAAPLGASERAIVERLAAEAFDAAIVFTVCTQSALPAALLCRMAGIGLRLAYSRENPYGLLSDRVPETDVPGPGMRHEVRRQLDLVRAVGFETDDDQDRLVFATTDADRAGIAAKLAAAGIDRAARYLVVHPGATAASRRYSPARYGQAAQAVARRTGCRIVCAGGSGDLTAVDEVLAAIAPAERARTVSFAGELALGELAALIAGAAVTLCNNSAPAHLAAAVGARVVVPYALTNPQHTPWRTAARVLSHEVPCRDCLRSVCPEGHHACLAGVAAHDVADAALELMSQMNPMETSR